MYRADLICKYLIGLIINFYYVGINLIRCVSFKV